MVKEKGLYLVLEVHLRHLREYHVLFLWKGHFRIETRGLDT